jgi:hypothetical protein
VQSGGVKANVSSSACTHRFSHSQPPIFFSFFSQNKRQWNDDGLGRRVFLASEDAVFDCVKREA